MVFTVEITLTDGTTQAALFFNEERARKARDKAAKRPDVVRAALFFCGHEWQ